MIIYLDSRLQVSFSRDVVEEAGEGASGVVAHVLELGHKLVAQLLINHGHLRDDLGFSKQCGFKRKGEKQKG